MTSQTIKPLSSQFFSNLIKLETDFITKNYTAATLDELVDHYSEAVEYYDSIKDQIAAYFVYKLQDTLAQKKSIKILNNESVKLATPKGGNVKDFFGSKSGSSSAASTEPGSAVHRPRVSFIGGIILENMNEDNSDASEPENDHEDDDDEEEEDEFDNEDDEGLSMEELRMRARNRKKSQRKSIATLKKKTQKLFTLQMKLQNEKASVRQTLAAVLEAYELNKKTNDALVASNLSNQRKQFRKRVEHKLQPEKTSLINIDDRHADNEYTGSTVFIDTGNSPNFGEGLLHDGGSSL